MHISVAKHRKNMYKVPGQWRYFTFVHICCNKTKFLHIIGNKTTVMLPADKFIESPGIGTVILQTENR